MAVELREREIYLSHLHQHRFDALVQLYSLLSDVIREYKNLITPLELTGIPSKDERFEIFREVFREFYIYSDRNKVILNDETDKFLTDLIGALNEHATRFLVLVMNQSATNDSANTWKECWKASEDKLPVLRKALEHEIQKLLGMNNN
jgi:hypothetical protein